MNAKAALVDVRPVQKMHTDVLVVGGGAAGVAAAVIAARQGVSVTLVERYGFCGGGAVAGMSGTICGMFMASDVESKPEQLVHGFADEFARRMTAAGGLTPPVRYGKTFSLVHDPLVWRNVADAMLADASVRVLFHAIATEVLVEDGERIGGVQAWTKQGKFVIEAALTVDATGDADVLAMAGLPTSVGHAGSVQNPTMMFRIQGVDVDRFLAAHGSDAIMGDAVSRKIVDLNETGAYRLPRAKVFLFRTPRLGELLCNCTRIIGAESLR